MAGLPQAAQLVEHQRAEARVRIAEQIAERVQLLLHPDGRAFLLLQPVAQQVKFVLEVGVRFFQPARFWKSCMRRSSSALTLPPSAPTLRKLSLSIKVPPQPSLVAGHQAATKVR
jgi:hypothetical protein